jgi:Flp pilus assembly protein TadD
LLARQGDKSQARTLYQEALKVDPKDFSALYNLHLLSRADQQPELAADYLRQGLAAYPDSAMFIAMRGRQSGLAGDVKGACRDLAAALQVLPRRADFWNIYADFLQRDGQAAQAETARSKARKLGAK